MTELEFLISTVPYVPIEWTHNCTSPSEESFAFTCRMNAGWFNSFGHIQGYRDRYVRFRLQITHDEFNRPSHHSVLPIPLSYRICSRLFPLLPDLPFFKMFTDGIHDRLILDHSFALRPSSYLLATLISEPLPRTTLIRPRTRSVRER
jgi:hypothetical protein